VWLAVLCLIGVGSVVAINAGTSTPAPNVEATPDRTAIAAGFSQDALTKADKLEIAYVRDLNLFVSFFCERFRFPEFPLGLQPKLQIPSIGPVIFFPDFPSAISNFGFLRFCESAGALFQLFREGQYALDRFPIAYPPGKLAVLVGLRQNADDNLPLIHDALEHLVRGPLPLFNYVTGIRLIDVIALTRHARTACAA
jgi:hypothetical protein